MKSLKSARLRGELFKGDAVSEMNNCTTKIHLLYLLFNPLGQANLSLRSLRLGLLFPATLGLEMAIGEEKREKLRKITTPPPVEP
jgi:hypothetical protein